MRDFIYYNGKSCAGAPAMVQITPNAVRIENPEGKLQAIWPLEEVIAPAPLPDPVREPLVLRCDDFKDRFAGQRLVCFNPDSTRELLEVLRPNLRQIKSRERRGLFFALPVIWLALAAAFYGLPILTDQLAPLISQRLEQAVGDSYIAQLDLLDQAIETVTTTMFGQDVAEYLEQTQGESRVWLHLRPTGQDILDQMAERLWSTPVLADLPGHTNQPTLHIVRLELPNAFTIPGNHIILTTGFLRQMDSLDELAGVLAHEMAHVAYRHTPKQWLKVTGLQYLTELLAGGASHTSSAALQGLLSARWSQKMESEADDLALVMLRQAQISPLGLARFFEKAAQTNTFDELLPDSIFTHPPSLGRAEMFAAAPQYPVLPLYGQNFWRSTSLNPEVLTEAAGATSGSQNLTQEQKINNSDTHLQKAGDK